MQLCCLQLAVFSVCPVVLSWSVIINYFSDHANKLDCTTTEYISWQNQADLSGVFRPVSITLLVSRAGNTTYVVPKNKMFCKFSIQVNKCMKQRRDRDGGGCSNQNQRFVYVSWGLCDHLIQSSLSNNGVSIYLQRRSDIILGGLIFKWISSNVYFYFIGKFQYSLRGQAFWLVLTS